jgi:hypothetical protein
MYFVRAFCVLLVFCFCRQSLFAQDSVEQWQKLTIERFPQIAVKGSELNLKYVQRVKTLRDTDPSFFRDPRWPYAVAEQITTKSLIPGIEDVVVPPSRNSNSSMHNSSTSGVYTPSGTRVDIIAAKDVAVKGAAGQMICVQGVIAKTMLPGLAVQDRFYLQLKPDLICEFMVAQFFTRSGRSLGEMGYDHNYSQLKLRFLSGSIFIYGPRSRNYEDRNSVVKLGEIFNVGEKVCIYGRLEGSGSVGIDKGLMIRDCVLLKPN